MFPTGLSTSWQGVGLVVVCTPVIYLALITYSRMVGLRSFAQMTNFDMAAFVAFGSITATTAVSTEVKLIHGLLALGVLFATQALIAWLRGWGTVEQLADSRPLLLMSGSEVLPDQLDKGQMTEKDLRSKLRLAGVTRDEQIRAVVLETTGDVSVLVDDPGAAGIDTELLAGVDGSERLTGEASR